jgi:hypothetical protein
VTENPVPVPPPIADVVVLGLLIAPRDAARVALGGLHVRAAPIEPALHGSVVPGALFRTALRLFAVRGHRSSNGSKLAFSAAYHVITE